MTVEDMRAEAWNIASQARTLGRSATAMKIELLVQKVVVEGLDIGTPIDISAIIGGEDQV